MKHRRHGRRLALDVLYEAEIREQLPVEAFRAQQVEGWLLPEGETEPPHDEAIAYARKLVGGVQEHQADIDAAITRYAERWRIDRMPVIDRNILRIGMYELLWAGDVPPAVAINEAVELAKSLSTDDSGRFINGLLGKLVDEEDLQDRPDPARSPDDR